MIAVIYDRDGIETRTIQHVERVKLFRNVDDKLMYRIIHNGGQKLTLKPSFCTFEIREEEKEKELVWIMQ